MEPQIAYRYRYPRTRAVADIISTGVLTYTFAPNILGSVVERIPYIGPKLIGQIRYITIK